MRNCLNIAIIGRSEMLYNTAVMLIEAGYNIPLIITAKEAPEYKIKAADYKNLAERVQAHFIQTPKINSAEIINDIKNCGKIDVAISVNYSGIIEQEVIDLFPLGILNAHGGDLPRYRGNACQAWAIINGEKKIGMCIHKMKGGELDNGDIIAKDYLDININTRIGEVYEWMEKVVPQLMLNSVNALQEDNGFLSEVQSVKEEDSLRCYPRNPDDGQITWTNSNEDILRLVNASSEPFAGAFCYFDGVKMIIWRADLIDDNENYLAVPGQVSKINKDGSVELISGKGKIRITDVEINGDRSAPARFINSIRKRLK
jgi:UDP-4-amino-4-deoxy-L-arabinose formyltransferase/UDP-glucuronic acid dehydrogenase (UDP-4-keto-hexauronic acid decarboxylating)